MRSGAHWGGVPSSTSPVTLGKSLPQHVPNITQGPVKTEQQGALKRLGKESAHGSVP